MNNTNKRYWLFTYNQYYPVGGINDYQGSYDTVEECKNRIVEVNKHWYHEHYHILDTQDMVIVEISEYGVIKTNITVEEIYKENNP